MASDYPGRTVLVGYFIENQRRGPQRNVSSFRTTSSTLRRAHCRGVCGRHSTTRPIAANSRDHRGHGSECAGVEQPRQGTARGNRRT